MSHRHPTVACLLFLLFISPLCGVAPTPDCGIIILAVSSRGVIQTLVWHQYYYSCSFLSRSHSDPRLAPSIYFLYVWSHWLTYSCASCLHLLYLMSELSCEYFHSTHLACWFGQMLTKAISWMKSLIVSPTPRGVPVSPVRSWILVTCIIYASATRNKSPRASLRRSKSCSFQESYHPLRCDISTTVVIVS